MSSANAAPEEEMVAMVAANNAAFFATVLLLFFETTFFAVFCFVFVVRWMMMKIKREREREKSVSIFFLKPQTYLLRVFFPVKVADGGRISSHAASFREKRINEKRRNPPLSLSRRDAREKGEVKGTCERSRDDDPYFCHLGFPCWEKSIRERERERNTATTNLRKAKRFKAKKAKKGKQRENDGNRIFYLVRAGRRNDDRSGRDGKHFLVIISDG